MGLNERMVNYAKLAERIRETRERSGKTQEEVALIIDMNKAHMSHVETNNTHASLGVVIAIANALNASVDSLVVDSLEHPEQVSRVYNNKFDDLLKDCSVEEAEAIYISANATKEAIRSITEKKKY